jgi:aquaporin Z
MKRYIAELVGTFALVFVGCGSAVIAGSHIGYAGIAFAFGLTVLAMIYAIGPISACHINPAITLGILTIGKISVKDTIGYIIAQCLGAIIAAAVLLAVASGKVGYSIALNGLGQNGYGAYSPDNYSLLACLIAEFVLTFLFLIVVFGSTHKKAPGGFAGLSIGFALVLIHLVGIPITGTSVNPARSLGPAVMVGGAALSQLWLFIVAPILGAVVAGLVWMGIVGKEVERLE